MLGIVKETVIYYEKTFVFPVEKVAKLRFEIIVFKQLDKESLGKAWDRFDSFVNSGPNLALPEPMLLQYFFLGLNDKNQEYLNLASGGAFMHITVDHAKTILTNILNDFPEEKEELLEEESQLAENKPLPDLSQSIVELDNETEITPILNGCLKLRMISLMILMIIHFIVRLFNLNNLGILILNSHILMI